MARNKKAMGLQATHGFLSRFGTRVKGDHCQNKNKRSRSLQNSSYDCLSTNVNIFNQVCQGLFDISKKSL